MDSVELIALAVGAGVVVVVAGAVLLLKPIGGDRTKGRDESDFSGDY